MIQDNHARQIIQCLGLQQEEKVVIIGDSTSQEIVQPVSKLIKETNPIKYINLDDYQRPLSDVPEDLSKRVEGAGLCLYVIDKKANAEVSEITFRRALNSLVENINHGRIGSMLSITPEVIESAFAADASKIKDLSLRIQEYMTKQKAVNVNSKKGTDVLVEFDPEQFPWLCSTGFIKKGKTRNVMPAEVYVTPADVNGTVVIDGTYGYLSYLQEFKDNQATLKRLDHSPIVWQIKNGRITDVRSNDKAIETVVREQVFDYENADRIGEYGMGTNIGIHKLLGIMMHDEKYPKGPHFAHGKGEEGANWDCNIHYDGLTTNATIKGSDLIMKDGQYNLDLFNS